MARQGDTTGDYVRTREHNRGLGGLRATRGDYGGLPGTTGD